jgi:hypothetical protein
LEGTQGPGNERANRAPPEAGVKRSILKTLVKNLDLMRKGQKEKAKAP